MNNTTEMTFRNEQLCKYKLYIHVGLNRVKCA